MQCRMICPTSDGARRPPRYCQQRAGLKRAKARTEEKTHAEMHMAAGAGSGLGPLCRDGGSRPSSTAVALRPAAAAVMTPVQFRRGGFGRGLGLGLGIGVLGAIIANEAYRPRPGVYYDEDAYDGPCDAPAEAAGDPRGLCAEHFRSFERNTGLYTAYSGEKRLCPHLR